MTLLSRYAMEKVRFEILGIRNTPGRKTVAVICKLDCDDKDSAMEHAKNYVKTHQKWALDVDQYQEYWLSQSNLDNWYQVERIKRLHEGPIEADLSQYDMWRIE